MSSEGMVLSLLIAGLGFLMLSEFFSTLSTPEIVLFILASGSIGILGFIFAWTRFSKAGRENQKRKEFIQELPKPLLSSSVEAIQMGRDLDLGIPIYLPDSLRSRHVHILGATGSGKTESVILNFLRQDVNRGLGSIILDAKGETSFLTELRRWVPTERLQIFDLGGNDSSTYDPLTAGSPLEAAERLFASLTWSEEYYKSKAKAALQRLFQVHARTHDRNPRLSELVNYLEDQDTYAGAATPENYPKKLADRDFMELSGLRDQVRTLCTAHLEAILSPTSGSQMKLEEAKQGQVLYFRLQSLLSPQLVSTVGKLLINHLTYLAGVAHRSEQAGSARKLIPTYLDEFASFACPEFAELISKARSAGIALHFSHQSIGDLVEVSEGFLNRITDNSATKIILRINDPESADYFARAFGTKIYQKITQRVTNVAEVDLAEVVGEGTQREAHQFRASPDLFKTLPTGVGSILIAHGYKTPHGASSVFKIAFPALRS